MTGETTPPLDGAAAAGLYVDDFSIVTSYSRFNVVSQYKILNTIKILFVSRRSTDSGQRRRSSLPRSGTSHVSKNYDFSDYADCHCFIRPLLYDDIFIFIPFFSARVDKNDFPPANKTRAIYPTTAAIAPSTRLWVATTTPVTNDILLLLLYYYIILFKRTVRRRRRLAVPTVG